MDESVDQAITTMQPVTLTLHEALELFEEHTIDILDATSANLTADLKDFDAQYAWVEERTGTERELAEAVRTMAFEERIAPAAKRVERIARHLEEKSVKHPRGRRLSEEDIARAKEYPIRELYCGRLTKSGRDYIVVCPFHNDSSPSMRIYADNHYHCFSCGSHGDSIAFYMQWANVNFPTAVRYLAGR